MFNGVRLFMCTASAAMLNWLQKHNCILANPLANVEKVSTVGKETFKRRALTDDEVKRLLEVSEARRPIYLTALLTGLRRKEINSLEGSYQCQNAPSRHHLGFLAVVLARQNECL